MKILVLGATGQIGYALTTALARTEHRVSVLVRNAAGLTFPQSVSVMEQKELTPAAYRAALVGADHVIYAIGLPEQFQFDNGVFERVNCELLEVFLAAMEGSRARALTYISTYEVFEVIDGAIAETHPVADESRMTPYSRSKVRAYRSVVDFAQRSGIKLTTIHPAAVFGGMNTGGITDYMDNLVSRKWYRVPFINAGSFPIVHVDSLADAIIRSLDKPGAYIASDQMATLKSIAQAMRVQSRSYVPVMMPLWFVKLGVFLMEAMARIVRIKPLLSAVEVDFLTRGWRPSPDKAIKELGWQPMTLQDGVGRFLSTRLSTPSVQPKKNRATLLDDARKLHAWLSARVRQPARPNLP